jgi:hypothetical protein
LEGRGAEKGASARSQSAAVSYPADPIAEVGALYDPGAMIAIEAAAAVGARGA